MSYQPPSPPPPPNIQPPLGSGPGDFDYHQPQNHPHHYYDPAYGEAQPENVEFIDGEEFITMAPPKKEGYWRRIGGGSLGISIIIHALLVILFLIWFIPQFTNTKGPEEIDFLPGGGGGGDGNNNKVQAKRRQNITQNAPKARIAANVTNSALVLPDVTANFTEMSSSSFSMPSGGGLGGGEGGLMGKGKGGKMGDGWGNGFGPGKGGGFLGKLPGIMKSRCDPKERIKKMKENGGDQRCEDAVVNALNWLQKKQNPDGSWGQNHKGAMTGLALLAYYGHCETPDSPVYGKNVIAGLSYLVELGNKNGGLFTVSPGGNECTYEHGIGAYAMGETYSFSKFGSVPLPGVREAFEKGVEIILKYQNEHGSWSYGGGVPHYESGGRNDPSVTGWQFQALKAARHSGLKIKGLEPGIKKLEGYLESIQNPSGGFGSPGDGGYSEETMSGIGVLGLQTLSKGGSSKADKGIKFLLNQLDRQPLQWNKNADLYCWYYNTQAFFQKGGAEWATWNKEFQDQLLKNQNPDGGWRQETPLHGICGSGAAGADAEIYRNCLCVLMMEVYYRYLKVGDREGNDFGVR